MPFDGSGTYTVTYTWVTEGASPPIALSKLDTELTGIASALSNCLLRDGTGIPSADISWNGKKLTTLADSTTRTGAPATKQVQDNSFCVVGSVAGTDTITGSLTPAITAYAAGMQVVVEPANTNTAGATLNLNSVGAATLVKWDGDALSAGDLVQNVPALAIYDGSNFVVVNPQLAWTGFDTGGKVGYRNIPLAAASTYTLAATDVGRCKSLSSGGATIPASVFTAGDVFVLYNNSSSSQTITQGASTTLRLAGSATTGNRTLAQRGLATVVCVASNEFVIGGMGVT